MNKLIAAQNIVWIAVRNYEPGISVEKNVSDAFEWWEDGLLDYSAIAHDIYEQDIVAGIEETNTSALLGGVFDTREMKAHIHKVVSGILERLRLTTTN